MSANEAVAVVIITGSFVFTSWISGLMFYGLRPLRHAKATDYLRSHPAKSFIFGFLFFLIPFIACFAILQRSPHDGILLVSSIAVLIYGIGCGVSGRCLAEGMMPDASPMLQVCIGSALIFLSMAWFPVGLVLIGIATSMGFGAWLRARKL